MHALPSMPSARGQDVGEPGQALGAPAFASLLVAAGADARWATPAWTANHLRWVAWKLASLERRHTGALAGRALTAPVVLDQLKYRCGAQPAKSTLITQVWHLMACRAHSG